MSPEFQYIWRKTLPHIEVRKSEISLYKSLVSEFGYLYWAEVRWLTRPINREQPNSFPLWLAFMGSIGTAWFVCLIALLLPRRRWKWLVTWFGKPKILTFSLFIKNRKLLLGTQIEEIREIDYVSSLLYSLCTVRN